MYHINCNKCGDTFWSEERNISGEEICPRCKRIQTLESAMQKFVGLSDKGLWPAEVKHFRSKFKKLLSEVEYEC